MSKVPVIIFGAISGGGLSFLLLALISGASLELTGALFFLLLFPLGTFILLLTNYNSSAAQEGRKKLLQNQRFKLLKDYQDECSRVNLNGLNPEAKRQKINLIGRKYFGSSFNEEEIQKEIVQMRYLQKEQELQAEKKAEENKLAAQRASERRLYESLTRYAEYIGFRKRLKILEDEKRILLTCFNRAQEAAKQAKRDEESIFSYSGGDWAINGGIASAIAGPAAGIVAATNTMHENEEIKRYKPMLIATAAAQRREKEKNLEEAENELKACKNEIESTKLKLVSDISDNEVFKSLIISGADITISETGAVTIKTKVKPRGKIEVFGNIDTVIDGSIKAMLYANKKVVGEAVMVMPKYGVFSETYIEGICLNPSETNCSYDVKMKPYHLWYMEK